MSGIIALRDYIRDAAGAGINGASWVLKRLVDDTTLSSGSTASDTDPNTSIAGMLQADETTVGYPGSVKYVVTDSLSGAVREHTSKSVGIVGPWRTVDIPRGWRLGGLGVVPGINNQLEVTTNGTNMVISVASGEYLATLGEAGLLYAWPAARTLTADTADATNPRIDTVALRFYPPGVEQEGRIDLVLVKGTAASSPSAPSLTQNLATYWEEALADVRVDAGVTSLASNKVTDRRRYCFLYPSDAVAGDTFYVDANGKFARLAKGTSGHFLKQGAAIPSWAALASADISDLAEFIRDTIGTALVAGSNATVTVNDAGDTITIAATATGDVTGQSSSVDSEVALFSGTGGKTIKRASASGYAKLASGVLSAVSFARAKFGYGYRSSTGANITSTTGTNLGSLTCSVTLDSGYTWDLVAFGSINANAPASDYIYATCRVDGDTMTDWTDTGTASGERALGFVGVKEGVSGDGLSHSANAVVKVGSGTGSVNTGYIVLIAIPRAP